MGSSIVKTDVQLQRNVLEELEWDTRVTATDVGVEARNGVVTLSGTVGSWAERTAAQKAAHRVSDVLDVVNDIRVKLPGASERTDADIAHAVRHALEWDVTLPHERIRTTVSNGVVTLEGELDFWSQHDDAGHCVQNLAGVREVKNVISVRAAHTMSPETVRTSIVNALERHADRSAHHVQIALVDDKVILSGWVPSYAEREAVEGAARGTPGVHRVENQLRVQR